MAEVLISGLSHSADDGTSRTAAKCHTSVDLLIAGRASVFSQKHRAMIGHMPGERVSRFVSFHKLNTANIFLSSCIFRLIYQLKKYQPASISFIGFWARSQCW